MTAGDSDISNSAVTFDRCGNVEGPLYHGTKSASNKKFPGNITHSYRTRYPLQAAGEMETWVRSRP